MDLFLSDKNKEELNRPVLVENTAEKLNNDFVLLDYGQHDYEENMVFANHHTLLENTQALSQSKKTFGDSDSMKEVKRDLMALYALLGENIPADKDDFLTASQNIAIKYEELLSSLKNYIDTHHPRLANGKARLAMIKEIYSSALMEKEYFEAGASAYADSQYDDRDALPEEDRGDHDFLYLLKFARAARVDVAVINEGGSTDSIRKYTEDGKTYYYKKTEYIQDFEQYSKMTFDKYNELLEGQHGETYAYLTKELDNFSRAILSTARNRVNNMPAFAQMLHDNMMELLFSAKGSSKNKKAIDFLDSISENEGFDVVVRNLMLFLDRNEVSLRKIAAEFGAPMHTSSIAKHNRIHPGANMTMRSVASSRLDKFLGINGIVETKSVLVKGQNGIVETGMRMNAANGISMSELKRMIEGRNKAAGRNVCGAKFSPEAARKFQEILLLDFLLGQADRHNGNIKVVCEEVNGNFVINDVIGIDNDMCLGDLKGADVNFGFNRIIPMLKKGSKGKIRSEADCVIKAVHKDTYDKFINLQPETLVHMFADCGLSKEEWAALKERLTVLKSVLTVLKERDDKNKARVEGRLENRMPFIMEHDEFQQSSIEDMFDAEGFDSKSLLNLMPASLRSNPFEND